VIAFILLPHDIWLTYYSILKTSVIGPNLKTFACLLLPFPLLLWPIFVLLASILYGFGIGLFAPTYYVFNEDVFLCGGPIIETLHLAVKSITKFWKFNYDSYFTYLREFREDKLPEAGKPFDISVLQMIVGLFIGLIGFFVVGLSCGAITFAKCLPAFFRGYYEAWKAYIKIGDCWICVLLLPFLVANILYPFASIIILLLILIAGCGTGFGAGIAAYKMGFFMSFRWMLEAIRTWDKFTNMVAFDFDVSCCGNPDDDIFDMSKKKQKRYNQPKKETPKTMLSRKNDVDFQEEDSASKEESKSKDASSDSSEIV